ncbi:MAG: spermidine/putrescine transport system ATP-binding protein [Actinomycetota bacterium]|jgi:spermidine/putrescine transport system ATP-binding protein|nr:spermidine/putrescine transport system ATP-binding protein [Actinomycetota bacterium]
MAVPEPPTSDVRLDHVTKAFKETVAVRDLSLDIDQGEFFSLLGPSGCGKTTTLRMIGGFEEPTSGRVFLGGRDVTDLPPYKRDVNTVFQSYALFPHLNVFENIAFGPRRKKKDESRGDMHERVRRSLQLVDLPGYETRKPSQLSGGEQQRVALARALINEPKVLLLDEPLGALDLKLRKQMQLEFKTIQQRVGITFIYVTHDQEEAMTMSNQIAVMRAGEIEQIGTPESMYESPATEFVASFLGASNLLDGVVKEKVGDVATVELTGGVIVRLPSERVAGLQGPIRVGVRPEKLTIEPKYGGSSQNAIMGIVRVAAFVGVSYQFAIEIATGDTLTMYAQNLGADAIPRPGEEVRLAWQPQYTFAVKPDARLVEENA